LAVALTAIELALDWVVMIVLAVDWVVMIVLAAQLRAIALAVQLTAIALAVQLTAIALAVQLTAAAAPLFCISIVVMESLTLVEAGGIQPTLGE
jgi:hypothetical protein